MDSILTTRVNATNTWYFNRQGSRLHGLCSRFSSMFQYPFHVMALRKGFRSLCVRGWPSSNHEEELTTIQVFQGVQCVNWSVTRHSEIWTWWNSGNVSVRFVRFGLAHGGSASKSVSPFTIGVGSDGNVDACRTGEQDAPQGGKVGGAGVAIVGDEDGHTPAMQSSSHSQPLGDFWCAKRRTGSAPNWAPVDAEPRRPTTNVRSFRRPIGSKRRDSQRDSQCRSRTIPLRSPYFVRCAPHFLVRQPTSSPHRPLQSIPLPYSIEPIRNWTTGRPCSPSTGTEIRQIITNKSKQQAQFNSMESSGMIQINEKRLNSLSSAIFQ